MKKSRKGSRERKTVREIKREKGGGGGGRKWEKERRRS